MRICSPREIAGEITAPPSKAMTCRALAAALLADGQSELRNCSMSDDGLAAIRVVRGLGATVRPVKGALIVRGGDIPRARVLDCGESGLCMRMFACIASISGRAMTLTARGSLRSRPVRMVEALRKFGVSCRTRAGCPPVRVKGPLLGDEAKIDGAVTSQFLSGLLMALPLCENDSLVVVENLQSRPYVQMTIDTLRRHGIAVEHEGFRRFTIPGRQRYAPRAYDVEGDWSGAAFMLVAGAVGGRIKVNGLDPSSAQSDRVILDVLKAVGAKVSVRARSVEVESAGLRPFHCDVTDCPDLVPPLAALASACDGSSVITGCGRLVYKESDRLSALVLEFGKLGIKARRSKDQLEIRGGTVAGESVDSHSDHRIAMACATAGLRSAKGVKIRDWQCVSKSYPGFFSDLASVCV
ncbi:MAG: 3-phosphoshikimate 1-carboxyvinyltransferase [Planctomycetota bacterium]|nr:3-phosphoshikimate 1-carboxyvinyltransferase [Planctomycetota bacterium]